MLRFGNSAGVKVEVAARCAAAGTGVEGANGTGEEEAGGTGTLTGWVVGLATGDWAKSTEVKRHRKLRIKTTCFISNVALIGFQ